MTADVYCADNLPLLQTMTDQWVGRFQLILPDPPSARQDLRGRVADAGAVLTLDRRRTATTRNSRPTWLGWPAVSHCAATRWPTAARCMHPDWHAVHYVKVELDRLFGRKRFLNEIIWCYHGPSPIRSAPAGRHDPGLHYGSANTYFDADAVRAL